MTVHPRVCGEHWIWPLFPCQYCGSSPRVRGTLIVFIFANWFSRFIPACAGNILRCRQRFCRIAVHPRVCGEHYCGRRLPEHDFGSSPRVRGTCHQMFLVSHRSRFIPACAGNMFSVTVNPIIVSVHPRVCGEHVRYVSTGSGVIGSSPRVRGT